MPYRASFLYHPCNHRVMWVHQPLRIPDIKAGTFYTLDPPDCTLFFVGELRNQPRHMLYMLASPTTANHTVGIYSNRDGTMTSKSGKKTTLYIDAKRTTAATLCIRWEECHDDISPVHLPVRGTGRCMSRHDKAYQAAYDLYFSTLAQFAQAECFKTCKKKIVTGCMLQTCMSWLVAMPAPVPLLPPRMHAHHPPAHDNWHAMAPNEMTYRDDGKWSIAPRKPKLWQPHGADDASANVNVFALLQQDDSSSED